MLQVIITPGDKYSLAEEAQMAVEAGAQWLQLRVPQMSDEAIREAAPDIISLCREAGVMLTIEDNIAMARELGLHGVFIHAGANPVKVREELGAEAVIGTIIGSADSAVAMSRADIDYVALTEDVSSALIADVRTAGCRIPVVAYRPGSLFTEGEVEGLMTEGFSGLCGADGVFSTDDPVGRIEKILRQLIRE